MKRIYFNQIKKKNALKAWQHSSREKSQPKIMELVIINSKQWSWDVATTFFRPIMDPGCRTRREQCVALSLPHQWAVELPSVVPTLDYLG